MTREEAILHGKEQLEVFGGKHREFIEMAIKGLEREPKTGHCKWIKYDYRTICPKYHDNDNPYWRIPDNMGKVFKYCPYCGEEIEVEE